MTRNISAEYSPMKSNALDPLTRRSKFLSLRLLLNFLAGVSLAIGSRAFAQAPVIVYGNSSFNSWPQSWTTALASDVDDGKTLDLVGDAAHPCLQYASSSSYAFFRVQIEGTQTDTTLLNCTVHVFVRNTGVGFLPTYGFSWDNNNNSKAEHGLELTQPDTTVNPTPTTWATVKMADRDNNVGQKVAPDFDLLDGDKDYDNDGFVALTPGPTVGGGTTTYVDFAVSWSYLAHTYGSGYVSTLRPGQTWYIQAGVTYGGTDHSGLDDVIGVLGESLWSSPIPEPAAGGLLLGFLCLGAGLSRRRRATDG